MTRIKKGDFGRSQWEGEGRKEIVTEVYYRCMKIAQCNPSKLLKRRKKERELKKSNTDGVSLIKVHYKHVVNITMKTLCTISSS
jgi:hypothetical protein